MFDKLRFLLAAGILSVLCFEAVAADGESLWGYADASADVVVYINTKQPEKAMEKSIWERIQQDKDRAVKEKGGDGLFDTKDRDMELIANLRITSVKPFSGTVEGVANISGNMLGDIDKMMEMLKQQDGPMPEISRKDDMDFYNLSTAGDEESPATDFMLVPISPNQMQFRININPSDKMPQTLLRMGTNSGSGTEQAEALAKLGGQDVAFACFFVPEKFADIKVAETDAAESLSDFLQKVSCLSITAQVSGPIMILKGLFSFKSEPDAAAFKRSADELLPEMKTLLGTEQSPRSTTTGKNLEISIPLDISDAWDMISRFTDENGSLDFFGIEEESEDPAPTRLGKD